VKQILAILFSLFFQFSAASAVLADCFRHSHAVVEVNHHHGATSDVIVHSGSDHDDSVPRIHCAPLRFDIASLTSPSARSNTKPQDYKYRLASAVDMLPQHSSLSIPSRSIENAGRYPPYTFLIGLSPHLLLSVFRI
jgi:hypothetical protein